MGTPIDSLRTSSARQISCGKLRILTSEDTATKYQATLNALERIKEQRALASYYEILGTYTLEKWDQMPWPLSPVTCALKGWECLSPGVLRCSVCRKTCSFDLVSYYEIFHGVTKADQTMRAFLLDQFSGRLSEPGHDEKCDRRPLLRASLVDQFAIFTMKSFRSHLIDRLRSLFPVYQTLPVIVADYDKCVTARDTIAYSEKHFAHRIDDPVLAVNMFAIGLHGWQHQTKGLQKYLHCRECQREVDYSKFCTVDRLAVLQQNESDNFHPDMFSWPRAEEFRFDCRLEHLSWCPWIRPVVLSSDMAVMLLLPGQQSEKIVGCKVALAAFSVELTAGTMSGDSESDFNEQVGTFRRDLDACSAEFGVLRKKFHASRPSKN